MAGGVYSTWCHIILGASNNIYAVWNWVYMLLNVSRHLFMLETDLKEISDAKLFNFFIPKSSQLFLSFFNHRQLRSHDMSPSLVSYLSCFSFIPDSVAPLLIPSPARNTKAHLVSQLPPHRCLDTFHCYKCQAIPNLQFSPKQDRSRPKINM